MIAAAVCSTTCFRINYSCLRCVAYACVFVCSLRLFQNFEPFRVLVCGGDGSVSWVLNEIDQLGLQRQVRRLCRAEILASTI